MQLRAYQQNIVDQVIASESNDLVQLDTGAGKTPIIARLAEYYGHAVIVCHRNILIAQASEKLAACGIQHRILAAPQTRRHCARNNIAKHGRHFIQPRSTIWLVSIDTWHSHHKRGKLHFPGDAPYVVLIDEAHHFAEANKWEALQKLVDGRCIGFTATPIRGDGQPLTKAYGGFFDRIVQADGYGKHATERLIAEGYLAEYRAFFAGLNQRKSAGVAFRFRVELVKLAVDLYANRERGKQAIVIYPRITTAIDALAEFRARNINAAVLHSKLPSHEIERVLTAFKHKHVNVLIAVDMISEGFDVPDADVLILARVIMSYGLYRQLCGRVLRPRPGKLAKIYDLNGKTIVRHGLPSDPVDWNEVQADFVYRNIILCEECGCLYNALEPACPECGTFHDLRKKIGSGVFKINIIVGKMLERYRQKLLADECKRLREAEEAEKARQWRETYITPKFAGNDTIAGRKCAEFHAIVARELQQVLSPPDYNAFFDKNNWHMRELAFFVGAFKPGDTDYRAQTMALYETHK